MSNHLAGASSPYLRQHAENPVDWYPWGPEALEKAKKEDKPIFLSIGYSACHWCHVMAHESFEDSAIAQIVNKSFVAIKVDREERPDLDAVYMEAVVSLTGQGGWPLTVFLTPDGKPFYGGTYFPPRPSYGRPSFRDLLERLEEVWSTRRKDVDDQAHSLVLHLQKEGNGESSATVTNQLLEDAVRHLAASFNPVWAGFGGAPQFPPSSVLEFLLDYTVYESENDALRTQALSMVTKTLEAMAAGGFHDQVGGGFHRYSVDEQWHVPHFEKMLYDNAQLAHLYLRTWKITGNNHFRWVAERTLDFIQDELLDPAGGWYSSLDADSEGKEGTFYTWTTRELETLLAGTSAEFFDNFGVFADAGNWEGTNVLRRPPEAAASAMSEETLGQLDLLKKARSKRIRPATDTKVLTAWNALALSAFAKAGLWFERPDYLAAATKNAAFLREQLVDAQGRLYRTWSPSVGGSLTGYLEDYACLIEGLLNLYDATLDSSWWTWARNLANEARLHFYDEQSASWFDTRDDHEILVRRPQTTQDQPIPSGHSLMACNVLKLALFDGDQKSWDLVRPQLERWADRWTAIPLAYARGLSSLAFFLDGGKQNVVVGPSSDEGTKHLLHGARSDDPFAITVWTNGDNNSSSPPIALGKGLVKGRSALYRCRWGFCDAPITAEFASESEKK